MGPMESVTIYIYMDFTYSFSPKNIQFNLLSFSGVCFTQAFIGGRKEADKYWFNDIINIINVFYISVIN